MIQLGDRLRELRQKQGLSQERLAVRAQVTVRTLRYWEANQKQPREVELESLLSALGVTLQERGQIYALLPEPRIVRLAEDLEAESGLPSSVLGSLPGLGDLLQAMRLRRGLTQEQAATAMGVTRLTITRWEGTQTLPSKEDIERLCLLLCASPEECVVLQSRRLLPMGWNNQLTLDECLTQYTIVDTIYASNNSLLALMDLYILALKRQVRLLLGQTPEALRLLVRLEAQHGCWLFTQNRAAASRTAIWRALDIARQRLTPEPFWVQALDLLTFLPLNDADYADSNVALLHSWLPLLPASLHFWVLCDMALHSGKANRMEDAAHFLQLAQRAMANMPQDDEELLCYHRVTRAGILLNAGKGAEAMRLLPPIEPAGYQRITSLFSWAEASLIAEDKNTATAYLSEAQELLYKMPLPRLQTRLDRLGQRL